MHSFTVLVFFSIGAIFAFAGYAVPKSNSYVMPPAYPTAPPPPPPNSYLSDSTYLDSPSTYESSSDSGFGSLTYIPSESESSFRRRAKARAPNTRPKAIHRRPLQPIRKHKKAKH